MRSRARIGHDTFWPAPHVPPAFEGRIAAIYIAMARRCAGLHLPDPQGERNALILATARVHGLPVVTRNASDLEATGVRLVNPWSRTSA